jgi:hypothetical protein
MERALIKVDCNTGTAVPEALIVGRIELFVQLINAGREDEICIGQAELALGIRVAVKQKKIEREVAFVFNGQIVPVMPNGHQMNWPRGFPGDVTDQLLTDVIGWGDKQ